MFDITRYYKFAIIFIGLLVKNGKRDASAPLLAPCVMRYLEATIGRIQFEI